MVRFAFFVVAACCSFAVGTTAADEATSLEFFEREIRPILVNRCYECHDQQSGPDSANLRLDHRDGWLAGGDSGPAVDVDQPAESLLLRAISYKDPDLQMPPRSKLPDREIDTLRRWIAAGAVGPEDEASHSGEASEFELDARRAAHWAWQPVVRPEVPPVQDAAWTRDDVDRFVLAKLEAAGLRAAETTDPATWLRRVTYDLTGLPPTPDEVRAFTADPSAAAEASVVDRLLASQAFGECWAQHWLDLVRFAESKGHEQDYQIPLAWRYRDYVIRALNANLPFDQFVIEQIAGDLLPEPRIDPHTRANQSIQATGWWHLGEATHSPVDIRGEEADRIDNQIDVFGKAFLGMTVACARCHDHKFDAISTADYYALCGFIQSSSYQEANVADPQLLNRLAAELEQLNHTSGRQLAKLYAQRTRPQLAKVVDLVEAGQFADSRVELLADAAADAEHPLHLLAVAIAAQRRGDDVASVVRAALARMVDPQAALAEEPCTLVVDFAAATEPCHWITSGVAFGSRPVTAGQVMLAGIGAPPLLRVAEHAAATNLATSPQLTGLYRTPTFEVTAKRLWYRVRGTADVFLDVDSHRTVSGPLHAVCNQKIDSPDKWIWFAHPSEDYLGHRVHVEFKPTGPFELAEVRQSDIEPRRPPALHPAMAAELAAIDQPDSVAVASATVSALAAALDRVADGTATTADARLANWLLADDDWLPPASEKSYSAFAQAAAACAAERQTLEQQIPEPQYALALLDGSGEDEFVHLRGSHKRLAADPTPRRFLTALGGEFPIDAGSGRLELARRVASPDNPLTARVVVNRIWSHLFGGGLVPTVDNLGFLGEPPTHPELLDYLAIEFVDSGWDVKQLIRRLVLSSTYRQQSVPHRELDRAVLEAIDPANKLLHATRVRRIPAEAIRDALFAVAGELDSTPFGPSVPVLITDFMRHNRSPEGSGPMDGECRRSIYIEVRRNAFNHFLAAFDKPLPFTTIGRRNQSNSAAQPLMLLNDPLVHHLTAEWATKLTTQFDDDTAAVRHAYLAAFARSPSEQEVAAIAAFVAERTEAIADASAEQLVAARHAAWCDVCLALVNSKEFVFLK